MYQISMSDEMKQNIASVVLWDRSKGFLPLATTRQYMNWLERHRTEWLKNRELPPTWAMRLRRLKKSIRCILGTDRAGVPLSDYLFRNLFPWALEEAEQAYSSVKDAAA